MAEMEAETKAFQLKVPSYIEREGMRVTGLSGDFTRETTSVIPQLWDRFNAELARLKDMAQWTESTYGVVFAKAKMHYVTGIEWKDDDALPAGWEIADVPAQHYAVLAEEGGLAAIPPACMAIWNDWLPRSGRKVA